MAGTVKKYDRHIFILDPVRGHLLWPTHLEESSFLLVGEYSQAQKALLRAAKEGGEEKGKEKGVKYALKFTVAEALGHPLAAPKDGMYYW